MMLDDERLHFVNRLRIIAVLVVVCSVLLLTRLWTVQIHQGGEHSQTIARQCIRRIRLSPVRGRIIASDGQSLLADNRPSFDVILHISEMRQPGKRSAPHATHPQVQIAAK